MDERALVDRVVREVMADLDGKRTFAADDEIDLAPLIDHTNLRPDAVPTEIDRLCDEALRFRFAAVCVHPVYSCRAVERLRGSTVDVAAVVGFPHGANLTTAKRSEAEALVSCGVSELDMVLPIGLLKSGDWRAVGADIAAVVGAARATDWRVLVKVIIEAGLLTDTEKVAACAIAEARGADFVKTSTGFAGSGATVADVALMRTVVGDRLGVKAAGGIRTREQALAFVRAGATRIGTSSGPALVGATS